MKVIKALIVVLATFGALAAQPAVAAPGFTPLNGATLPAMQRDLGLTRAQALAEFAASDRATGLERSMRVRLGGAFGGAVFHPATGRLEVRVTDPGKLTALRAAGVDAEPALFSDAALDSMVDRLNAREASAPASIRSWGADEQDNRVRVTVAPGGRADAVKFLADSGVGSAVVDETASKPRPMYDVRGGDAYYLETPARCSVGFPVTGGFLSAGHCAALGTSIYGYNGVPMGRFTAYRFPGADYSLAKVNSDWTPRGALDNGTRVSGSAEAPVGAPVCKAGSTTGWTCGRILAKNQTVRYAQGTVTGMIGTDVPAAAGDSGGPLVAGNQAQGLLSGGDSLITYFYPVRTALSATGARLVTG